MKLIKSKDCIIWCTDIYFVWSRWCFNKEYSAASILTFATISSSCSFKCLHLLDIAQGVKGSKPGLALMHTYHFFQLSCLYLAAGGPLFFSTREWSCHNVRTVPHLNLFKCRLQFENVSHCHLYCSWLSLSVIIIKCKMCSCMHYH